MAFDSLTEKLQNIFKNLRGKGRLTEDDVKEAMKEIKRALLAADVNFKVVKDFIKNVQERAIGQDVMNGLNPGQMVVKIVNEELVKLMGSETTEIQLQPGNAPTVILMAGLQGAGKTTTSGQACGQVQAEGEEAPSGSLRRLPPGSHQAAAGERGEAGGGGLLHGREPQACQHRKGGPGTRPEEWK